MLALFALVVPKAGIEDDVDVPAKPVVVAGVAPNGDLLSPNIVLLLAAVPNVRLGFCVPKVLEVVEEVPKVPAATRLAGVVFVPNMGTDVVLLTEPNILVVLPKADVVCDVPTLGVPNASVVFVLSKPEVIVPVETFPGILNVDVVVPACVVELNNDDVVPNMPLAVPKDGESFVCRKIGVLLPNTEAVVVVEVKLVLVLANKLELIVLFDEDAVLVVVVTKIEGTVVVGLLNIPVVPGTAIDAVPKNDWLLLVEPKIFVLVVVFDVVAKMDVVDIPNCGTVIVVLNCGVIVVVDTPNGVRTALFFIPPKVVILLVVVTGRTAAVDIAFEALEVPKTNRDLLVDEVDVEEVVDVLSENADALDNPVDVDVVNDVVFVIFVNGLLAVVVTKILDVKLKDLVVTCGNVV